MNINYDIIIIGSGISGLYSAYKLKNKYPDKSIVILERNSKKYIGGRVYYEKFYESVVPAGAGVGRKDTNKHLLKLLQQLKISFSEYTAIISYATTIEPLNIIEIIKKLKKEYKKHPELHSLAFKEFFIKVLNKDMYNQFILNSGYTDFEKADTFETLYNYGLEDNAGGWTSLNIPYKQIIEKLYAIIGSKSVIFSTEVLSINENENKSYLFEIQTNKKIYNTNKIIVATPIPTIKKLFPKIELYKQIHGQEFLRTYAKFNKQSIEIMKQYVPNFTIVPKPLQKIIPINPDNGIYMIAYTDNNSAKKLKNNLENTPKNCTFFCTLLEKALDIPSNSLEIIAIKSFYWLNGTHYYEPLQNFKSREEFLHKAQHPQKNILIVGEAVSRYQGWVEGAIQSVDKIL